jgi:hypothetical protein
MHGDRISTVGSHVLQRLRGWNPLPDQISFVGLLMSELQLLGNLRSVVVCRQEGNRADQKQLWNEPNQRFHPCSLVGREQRASQGNGRKVGFPNKCRGRLPARGTRCQWKESPSCCRNEAATTARGTY